MASSYSPNLALELITTGEQVGTWGSASNTNLGTLIEQAISGYATQAMADTNQTITIPNGATGVARNAFIECTGALTAGRQLIVPAKKKLYFIYNNTTGGFAITVLVSGQTGVAVPAGKKVGLVNNGTDIFELSNQVVGNLAVGGTFGVTGATSVGGALVVTGDTSVGGALVVTGNTTLSAGADIASATAVNLTTATGNTVVVTGTTTSTSLTMSTGQQMILLPSGAWPLTYHATTMNINGGVSYTCAAGDRLYCVKDLAGVIRVTVIKQDGTPLSQTILQNSQSAAYTTVLSDAGKHILHPTADNNARTFTIASNASVPYPIGAAITFVNQINTVTIAITTDTMTLAGAGTTGSRTLAANGIATALKVSATGWVISGTGLT